MHAGGAAGRAPVAAGAAQHACVDGSVVCAAQDAVHVAPLCWRNPHSYVAAPVYTPPPRVRHTASPTLHLGPRLLAKGRDHWCKVDVTTDAVYSLVAALADLHTAPRTTPRNRTVVAAVLAAGTPLFHMEAPQASQIMWMVVMVALLFIPEFMCVRRGSLRARVVGCWVCWCCVPSRHGAHSRVNMNARVRVT